MMFFKTFCLVLFAQLFGFIKIIEFGGNKGIFRVDKIFGKKGKEVFKPLFQVFQLPPFEAILPLYRDSKKRRFGKL